MNIERQQQVFEDTVDEMRHIMFAKGNDYANEDRLSNFKLAGTIAGGSAETNCLNLIATKVARLGVLLNTNATPNNESIDDTLVDLANYAVLLKMIREDRAFAVSAINSTKYDNLGFIYSPGDGRDHPALFIPQCSPIVSSSH